jgi:hypothetical protein
MSSKLLRVGKDCTILLRLLKNVKEIERIEGIEGSFTVMEFKPN